MTDALLNNAVVAVLLTGLAVLVIRLLPVRLQQLRGNIVIGVFIALLVLPVVRWIVPVGSPKVLPLRLSVPMEENHAIVPVANSALPQEKDLSKEQRRRRRFFLKLLK